MTSTLDNSPSTSPGTAAPVVRDRVGWWDLAWVTWRQHRLLIVGTAALTVAVSVFMLVLAAIGSPKSSYLSLVPNTVDVLSQWPSLLLPVFGALIATFWAAPLLSREFEQGTHLLVWSQDVPARRWLTGKTLTLLGVAVVLAAVLGVCAYAMAARVGGHAGLFVEPLFGANPVVQAGYAAFGFALGLLSSLLCRRTVLAMGVTLTGYAIVRFVVALLVRPYYMSPVRATAPLEGSVGYDRGYNSRDTLQVAGGYLDRAGQPVEPPESCYYTPSDPTPCLRAHGVARNYVDFHPVERLSAFRWIEFGVFAVLAAALFLVTWRVFRRVTRL